MTPGRSPGQAAGLWACAGLLVAAVLSSRADPGAYERFLGPVPAVAAVAVACLVACRGTRALTERGGFPTGLSQAGLGRAAALSGGFFLLAALADLLLRFPQDINLRFPQSLLFYPSIAIVAEAAFHMLPLAALFSLPVFRDRPALPLLVSALIEPGLQVFWSRGDLLAPLTLFTFFHVLGFNAAQLWLFRREGFAAMLGMRLIYYAMWHVGWGEARLTLLF